MTLTVLTINNSVALDEQIPGPFDQTNPVKLAALRALENAQGNPVRIIISNDPLDGYLP